MKSLSKIITGIITTSFLVGGFSVCLAKEYQKDIKVSKADTTQDTAGVYRRIDQASELQAGQKVIFVYGDDKETAFKDIFHPYSNIDAIGLEGLSGCSSYINDYLVIQSTTVEEFSVETGSATGSFAFKGLRSFNNQYITNRGGNGLGASSSVGSSSFWTLDRNDSYDDDYYFLVKSVSDNEYMKIRSGGGIGMAGGSNAALNIYVKQNITSINEYNAPSQQTYYYGDKINLSGMKVDIMINGAMGDSVDVSYDKCPAIFSISRNTADDFGYATVTVFAGASFSKNINIDIDVIDNPNYTYTRATSLTKDFRGTYLFVFVDENDSSNSAIFNSTLSGDVIDSEGNFSRGGFTVSGNKISGLSYNQTQMTMEIGRYDQDGVSRYYMKTPSGKYLKANYSGYSGYYSGFELVDTLEDAEIYGYPCEGKFCTSDGDITMHMDKNTVCYFWNTEEPYFSFTEAGRYNPADNEYYRPAYLYKLDTTSDTNTEVNNFVSGFKTNIKDNCDENSNNITPAMWTAQKNAFLALSVDAQGILANVTYNHGSETDGSMKDIIDLYDYIVSKYGYEDFMNRGDAGTLENNSSNNINPVIPAVFQNNAVIIVVITSIAAVSSLAIAYLLKKRRR